MEFKIMAPLGRQAGKWNWEVGQPNQYVREADSYLVQGWVGVCMCEKIEDLNKS